MINKDIRYHYYITEDYFDLRSGPYNWREIAAFLNARIDEYLDSLDNEDQIDQEEIDEIWINWSCGKYKDCPDAVY